MHHHPREVADVLLARLAVPAGLSARLFLARALDARRRASRAPTDPAVPTGGPEAWRVLSVGEARPPQGTSPVIRFEPGGRVSGTGACNGFFGPGQITPPVRIGPLGATLMACAPAAMEFDALLHAVRVP